MYEPPPSVGLSATEIAGGVRSRELSPVGVVHDHLEQIGAFDAELAAFQVVCAERALADAAALEKRDDLGDLPLAGVPVAIKDTIAVEGLPWRMGSLATPPDPATHDDEIVRRIRAAGALVMGKTKMPEFAAAGWTDSGFGVTRNPWDQSRTPGGSSGGSAAAIAAGLVPVAHGSDGGGSIRIPSAACGLVGIKPGSGVVPTAVEGGGWQGLSCDGPMATTAHDLALLLAVMAKRPDLGEPEPPPGALRIAWSTKPPTMGDFVDPLIEKAVAETVDLLAGAGHEVFEADPPHEHRTLLGQGVRAAAGIAESAAGLPMARIEARNRLVVRAGRVVRRFDLIRSSQRERFRQLVGEFFEDVDVLLTPTLATLPIPAEGWSRRSFRANTRAASFIPFTGPWNLAGYPAASVPAGMHPEGMPLAVQLIAPEGGEGLLLSLIRQLELLRPWPRYAPMSGIAEA